MIWARYFSSNEQRLNFLMMMFTSTSNFSFRKTVKSVIWNTKMIDFFEKNKKINQKSEKMIKKKKFLNDERKKIAYM